MNFVCLREKFGKGLAAVQRVVSRNFTLPILESVLIESEKGRLKLTATNLEVAIRCWVPGKVEKEGAIALPAAFLGGVVQNLHTDKIQFEVKGTVMHVKSEDYSAVIKGQNAEDFPVVPPVADGLKFAIGAKVFSEALGQLLNIVTVSEARPEISGVFMTFNKDAGLFVATDSFRLGEKQMSVKDGVKKEGGFKVIIPLRAAQELLRIIEKEEEAVAVTLGENQAMFSVGEVELTTRLIDGNYPDYEKVIPQEFMAETSFERAELMDRIRQVSVFSGRTNDIKLHFDSKEQTISVAASSSEAGEGETKFSAVIKGETTDVTFNYRYLLDGLENLGSEMAVLKVNDASRPSLLKAPKDETYRYIVMPIRD